MGRRKRSNRGVGKRAKDNKKSKTSLKSKDDDESMEDALSTAGNELHEEFAKLKNNTNKANENMDKVTSIDEAYGCKEVSSVAKLMEESFIKGLGEEERLDLATSMSKKEDMPTDDENCNSATLSMDMSSIDTQDDDDMDIEEVNDSKAGVKNPYIKKPDKQNNTKNVTLKTDEHLMEVLLRGGSTNSTQEDPTNIDQDINVIYERLLPIKRGMGEIKLYEEDDNDESSTHSSTSSEEADVDAFLDTITQDDDDIDDNEYWESSNLYNPPSENMSSNLRMVAWNAQNGLRNKVEPLAKYLSDMQGDCIAIQEPTVARVDFTDREKARWRKAASEHGYDMIITKHQWVLLKNRISKRLEGAPISVADGRLIAAEFVTGKTTRLLMVGVYGVVTTSSKSDGEVNNKNILRKELHKEINKIRHDFEEKCEKKGVQPIEVVLGDLQDTVTTSKVDNTGKGRKMHNASILKWGLDSGMTSIGYEWCKERRLKYLTRQGTKGSTGIDHILGNEHLTVMHFDIDEFGIHLFVNKSDHHLLYGDVDVNFQWEDGTIPASESIKYGAIYTIPIEEVKNEGEETTGFRYKSNKSEDELQKDDQYQLLSEFRNEMATNVKVVKMYQEALSVKNEIESEILRLTRVEQEKGSLQLIPRTSKLRGKLNVYFELLSTALDETLTSMNLIRKIPAKTVGHAIRKDTKVKAKPTDNMFKRMKNARSRLNKLDNALSIECSDLKSIAYTVENSCEDTDTLPIQKMLQVNNLNKHVTKKGMSIISMGVETLLELEEEISNQVDSIKREERINMKGLDPFDGRRINKQATLYNYACKDDKPILEKMDELVGSMGGTNIGSKFVDQLDDDGTNTNHTQQSNLDDNMSNNESSVNTKSRPNKGTSIETFWQRPPIIRWTSEDIIKSHSNPNYLLSFISDATAEVEKTRKGVQRLINRMNNSNLKRCLNDIRSDILANKLSGVTKRLIKEPHQAPEPYNMVLEDAENPRDGEGNLLTREARNVQEYLDATKQHHGNWTNDAGEEKYIHIMDEVIDIHGNTKFVVNKIRQPPNDEELKKLYVQGRVLSDDLKEHVRGAHNRQTLDIFENRPKINTNFKYPYAVNPSSDKVEFIKVRKELLKTIKAGHSKARHQGFHLAIIARMDYEWTKLWMSGIDFILATRMAPRLVKEMTRCPIPKPGKPGNTRPLTLAHDVWTFINSIIHDDLANAVEKTGVLGDEIIAYRKGKGAMDAMLPIISMLEECFATGEMIALSSEDEEKFFDRVGLIIQIYTMKAIGLPDDGFLELKAEDMYERECTVITKFGNVEITYQVGLPQGQTVSVLTCNTVGHAKVGQWTMEHENNPMPWKQGFCYAIQDKLDKEYDRVKNLLKFIYSDDATAIIAEGVKMSLAEKIRQNWIVNESSAETIAEANLEELETLIQEEVDTYIQQQKDKLSKVIQSVKSILNISGDFSKVTKIGRNSAKSDVAILNVDPELVNMIPKHVDTSEHSFEKAGPVMGKVPVCYSIRRPSDKATKEELEAYRNMIVIEKKLLGVSYGLNGDSAQTGRNGIKKAMLKIKDTFIPNAGPKVATIMSNTYIIPTTEWAVLLAKYDPKNLNKLDKLIIQKLRRHFGLTKSDSAIHLARPTSSFGGGLSSFVDRYICGLLREMEEACNNSGYHGVAIRSSLALTTKLTNKQEKNIGYTRYTKHNIITLAKYGYFTRDRMNILKTIFIEELRMIVNNENKNGKLDEIGTLNYSGNKRMSDPYIGDGNNQLRAYAYGNKVDRMFEKRLALAKRNKSHGMQILESESGWTSEDSSSMGSKEQRARAYRNSLHKIQYVVNSTLKCYQWTASNESKSPLDDNAEWETLEGDWNIDQSSDTPIWKQIEYEILRMGGESRIDYTKDSYRSILDRMAKSELPPIIATDGSHDGDDNSGSAVMFLFEGNGDWREGEWKPVLARLKRLPARIGVEEVDCGIGEAVGIALAEEILPVQTPAVILSDSRILALAFRIMRDATIPSNRKFIKGTLSGIGKGSTIRILKDIALWSKPAMEFLKSHAGILHLYGKPKEQFRFTGVTANLVHDCLGEYESDEEEDDDEEDPTSTYEELVWHKNKLDKKTHENAVEFQSYDFLGPLWNQKEQKKKLKCIQRTIRNMVSNNPNKPWDEVDNDANTHRIIITVRSHQTDKETGEPVGKFKELAPCNAFVRMNDMADKVCDLFIEDDEVDDVMECDTEDGEGMEVELRIPADFPFEIQGLRHTNFLGGREVTKSTTKRVKISHDNERRLMLAARDYNGLLARAENDIDITSIELGQRGGTARLMRGQGISRARAQRLDPYYNLYTILETDGSIPSSLTPLHQLSEEDTKKYLKEEELHKGVYSLCPCCGSVSIEKHRQIIGDLRTLYFTLDKNERMVVQNRAITETEEVVLPIRIDRFDWRRSTPLHATICTKEEVAEARDLGNQLVNEGVKTLVDMAEGYIVRYRINGEIPTLYNYMMQSFKEYELEPSLCSLGNSDGKYGIKEITRSSNVTIRNENEWEHLIQTSSMINYKQHVKELALASLSKYKYPITLGIFPPETVNLVKVYAQHPLDTCHMGWMPKIWKESIVGWTKLILETERINKDTAGNMKDELLKTYKRIRLAVYIRAQLIQKCMRLVIRNEKKELFKKYVNDEVSDEEEDDEWEGNFEAEDPLLDEEIDLQSESSIMSDDDTVSHIDSDDELELKESDNEEEEEDESAEDDEVAIVEDTQLKCNGNRCKTARRLGLDEGGRITDEEMECGKCRIFNADQTLVSTLETNIRNNARKKETTKLMQLNGNLKDAKSRLEEYLNSSPINPQSHKISIRHINYIANDLLVDFRIGRKLATIDQPLEEEEVSRIKHQSHQICTCNNEEVSCGEEEELPQLCQECNSIMTVPVRSSDLHCNTCNTMFSSDNKKNENGVCQACQVIWLIQNNNLQSRFANMKKDNDDAEKNPLRVAATKMVNDKRTITDPRIVKKNSKKDRHSVEQRVARKSKSHTISTSNKDEALISQIEAIWINELEQTEAETLSNERLDLLDKSKPMDNRTVMRLLNTLRKEILGYNYGVVSATFIYQLQNTNTDWKEMRKNFQTEDIDWKHHHDSAPYINHKFLLFPICISMGEQTSEWACMTRFEVEEEADMPWAYMTMDAVNNEERRTRDLRNDIKNKTTLHQGELHMYDDKPHKPTKENKDHTQWYHVQGVPSQANCESGHNMFLHFILMLGVRDTNSIQRRMRKLAEVESLEDKTRYWILEIVRGDRNFLQLPNWIKNIMLDEDESDVSSKEEDDDEEDDNNEDKDEDYDEDDDSDDEDNNNESNNKDGSDSEATEEEKEVMSLDSSTSSSEIVEIVNNTNRKRHATKMNKTIRSIIPQPTATQLRTNSIYFECDHLRPVLVRISMATHAAIASLNFMDRLNQKEYAGWAECRRDLYPGVDNNFTSIHRGQMTTANIDDNKLMIPIYMQGPPKHFLGIIRFKAKEEEDTTWNFAVIDSFDDRYLSSLHYMIDSRSTLAHNIPNISNNESNPHYISASWRSINCEKQEEVECGGRMALHFYIASKCNDIEEFQSKINRLSTIDNLGTKVRNWLVDWYETEDEIVPDTPPWLQRVIE